MKNNDLLLLYICKKFCFVLLNFSAFHILVVFTCAFVVINNNLYQFFVEKLNCLKEFKYEDHLMIKCNGCCLCQMI